MIFIPENVPSSKNSKVNGKFFSKTVMNYLKCFGIKSFSGRRKEVAFFKKPGIHQFPVAELKKQFENVEYPVQVYFHFVRKTRNHFDFVNICQILLDLFVAFDIIPDDDLDHIIPVCWIIDNKAYKTDKNNPGVYIKIKAMNSPIAGINLKFDVKIKQSEADLFFKEKQLDRKDFVAVDENEYYLLLTSKTQDYSLIIDKLK